MLTQPRQQPPFYQPYTQNLSIQPQGWATSTTSTSTLAPSAIPSPPQSHYDDVTVTNDVYSFGDFQPQQQYNTSRSLMQSERSNNNWLSNGQLTPSRARHHRESSLSSLGSTGPASPYTANTSNPQVAGEYHDFHDYNQSSSKPLTPVHTPLQEQFLTPHYTNYYPHSSNLAYSMSNDGLPKGMADAGLLPATEFNSNSERPSVSSVASHDSPSTPPAYEMEERRNAYRTPTMSKLTRTTSDAYVDGLYTPNFQITSAPAPSTQTISVVSPQNDVFTQRLQAASNQHINASSAHLPLSIPSRERSPFRQGSPLAPSDNGFGSHQSPNYIYNSATHLRKQQKAENDARAQQHLEISSPEDTTPKTISPKDVDLVYHETEEDANAPLFPPQQQRPSPTVYQHQPMIAQESSGLGDTASQQSYASMATSRRQSSSIYPASSQATPQHNNLNFAAPTVPTSISRQIPQQYPFVPQSRRQLSDLSNASVEFPATLQSMESSSSEYAPESSDNKRPLNTSADTGTYTCTYHGCTLRFETPAKLQRHKREGHRNSAALIASDDGSSATLRNSQNGPHKCERTNPSTGKPCNTIFSRPYDLTRHEDTIHNARKQKVRCHLCTEEKTFSRNDALTRHFRVVHPEHIELAKNRRRRD